MVFELQEEERVVAVVLDSRETVLMLREVIPTEPRPPINPAPLYCVGVQYLLFACSSVCSYIREKTTGELLNIIGLRDNQLSLL